MSVQIKAYLYEGRPCKSKEIRRFSIDHDVLSNYEYFRRKVASMFPNVGDNFALQWRDSDGDLVWFNSDEELLQALSQNTEDQFKVYIKIESAAGNDYYQRCGPKFRGQRFIPYQIPFGCIYQDLAKNFPFFSTNDENSKENADQPSASTTKDNPCEGVDSEYLQQMGKVVADFLHPFGIDVDINVMKKKKESETPTTSDASTTSKKTTSKPQRTTAEQSPASSSKEPPSSSDSISSKWTMIDNEEKADNQSKAAEEKMEDEEVDRLREALDRLLGMGFNDQGGWLTNLLKASDCDLGRALDAMQPNRSRKN